LISLLAFAFFPFNKKNCFESQITTTIASRIALEVSSLF
jgi:hypothetical protein